MLSWSLTGMVRRAKVVRAKEIKRVKSRRFDLEIMLFGITNKDICIFLIEKLLDLKKIMEPVKKDLGHIFKEEMKSFSEERWKLFFVIKKNFSLVKKIGNKRNLFLID